MLISVIVPVYNVEKYLNKCIDSILSQTYQNFELVIVNDGATDNSPIIIDDYKIKYPEKINVIHKKNGGLSSARNCGIENSNGDYLLFVDSDDWIEKNTLEVLNQYLENNSNLDMIVFDYVTEDVKGNIFNDKNSFYTNEYIKVEKNNIEEVFFKLKGYAWNKLYNKKLFQKVKFPEGLYYEDIGSYPMLFFESTNIQIINNSLYHYILQREGSIVSIKSYDKIIHMYENVMLFKDYLINKKIFTQYQKIFKMYQINILYTLFGTTFLLPKMNERNQLIKFIHDKIDKESINIEEIKEHQINNIKTIDAQKNYLKPLIKINSTFIACIYVNCIYYLLKIKNKIG